MELLFGAKLCAISTFMLCAISTFTTHMQAGGRQTPSTQQQHSSMEKAVVILALLYGEIGGDTCQIAEHIQKNIQLYSIKHSVDLSVSGVAHYTRYS